MPKTFVHLHNHSHYSLLDGLSQPAQIAEIAKIQGSPAIALTDHGNMHGAIEFYETCKRFKVKPIIGCEFYLAPRSRFDKEFGIDSARYHLVLLAKNFDGYKNLIKLCTRGFLEGMYYKPRIDFEILKKYSSNLIALSACLAGEIPASILNSDPLEKTKKITEKYLDIFGENFFLELQSHPGISEQQKANKKVINLAKEMKIPLVATNDSHYLRPEDADAHDILLCIQTNSQKSEQNRMSMLIDDFSIRQPEKMWEDFSHVPEACENTLKIAEKCEIEFNFGTYLLPKFPIPENSSPNLKNSKKPEIDFLKKECEKGFEKRYDFDSNKPEDSNQKKIAERLFFELEIIEKMGFCSYFLIVWDFVRYARQNKISVGPGRGSAAGSIVSYCLKITNIDPIRYNLLFERFLNPERVSMPDIDLDFPDNHRDEVIEYVREKYGENHVAQICTFGTMAARAAVKDVGRVLGLSFTEMNDFVKLIPERPGISLQEALESSPDLKKALQNSSQLQEIFNIAKKLEGCVRHV